MTTPIRFLISAIVLCSFSAAVAAQEAPTLEEAVRDQYVDAMAADALKQLESDTPLSGLDAYSHFLTEKELADSSSSAEARAFSARIGANALYLRIPVFHVKTSNQVRYALSEALLNPAVEIILIDLRGNRGGLLNAAVEVADEFVASGVIASTKGRQEQSNLLFLAKPDGLAENKHLLVLTDKNTASAAELLAGILRINGQAQLMGQNTYGKSAVQTHIQLKNGEALSLTTATYYFSDGSVVHSHGLAPDIKIPAWKLKRHPPLAFSPSNQVAASKDKFLKNVVGDSARP